MNILKLQAQPADGALGFFGSALGVEGEQSGEDIGRRGDGLAELGGQAGVLVGEVESFEGA